MEFRDHLKKTRSNLQWSDHCYFNIGLKSNKAIAKTVQAKEDFEKSDHCYHAFLSNCRQCPISGNDASTIQNDDFLRYFEQDDHSTDQQKENFSHIVTSSAEKKGESKLVLKLEGVSEPCGYSGKLLGKETLGDVSNSPEIKMCTEKSDLGLIDQFLPWEQVKPNKAVHNASMSADELAKLLSVSEYNADFPAKQGSGNSLSHTYEDDSAFRDIIGISHSRSEDLIIPSSDPCLNKGEPSEICCSIETSSESPVLDRARSLPELSGCVEDQKEVENYHKSSSQNTRNRSTAEVNSTEEKRGSVHSGRKRSDHSYCENSSKKAKKPKLGKADHTYMKTSLDEKPDVTPNGTVDMTHDSSLQKGNSNSQNQKNSEKQQVNQYCGNNSSTVPLDTVISADSIVIYSCNSENINAESSSTALNNQKVTTVTPVNENSQNGKFRQSSEEVRTVSVSLTTEGDCSNKEDHLTDTNTNSIGGDIASRAGRTKQVVDALKTGKGWSESDIKLQELSGVAVMQTFVMARQKAISERSDTLLDIYDTQGSTALSLDEQSLDRKLLSNIKTKPFSMTVVTATDDIDSCEKAESENVILLTSVHPDLINCNQVDLLQSTVEQNEHMNENEMKPVHSLVPLKTGPCVQQDRTSFIPPDDTSSDHSYVVPPVSLNPIVQQEANSAPFSQESFVFSQSSGVSVTHSSPGKCEITVSCMPVKLSTDLPLLHNLGNSGGSSIQIAGSTKQTITVATEIESKVCDSNIVNLSSTEVSIEFPKESNSDTSSNIHNSVLPHRKCKKPKGSMYEKTSKRCIGKHAYKKQQEKDIAIIPARRGCGKKPCFNTQKGRDSKPMARKYRQAVKISGRIQEGILVSPNRKLLQAVIIDHTYEEDKFVGQQVSVQRDHTYGQGRLKSRKSKPIRNSGINSNVSDHNYEPVV